MHGFLARHATRQERLGDKAQAPRRRERAESERRGRRAWHEMEASLREDVPSCGARGRLDALPIQAQLRHERARRARTGLERVGRPLDQEPAGIGSLDASAGARPCLEYLEIEGSPAARCLAPQGVGHGEAGDSCSEDRDPHQVSFGSTRPASASRNGGKSFSDSTRRKFVMPSAWA